MKEKENAVKDFLSMIEKSWTWDRLTEEERKSFRKSVIWAEEMYGIIQGPYRARYQILNALYGTFLEGTGYSGPYWREKAVIDEPQF